jgi:hypothetical protein
MGGIVAALPHLRPTMQYQFDIASNAKPVAPPLPPGDVVAYLLNQMNQILDLQRDQLNKIFEVQQAHLQHVRAMSQEQIARWRHILGKWHDEYPEMTDACKKAYPVLEKAYVKLALNLIEELAEQGDDALDTDFTVQEFLDRYGMKMGQLSHILSVIGPMSEAAQQNEAARQQAAQQQQSPPPPA